MEKFGLLALSGGGGGGLPPVTSSDNGKALTVVDGAWAASEQDFPVALTLGYGGWIADHDYDEVTAAIAAGKRVYATVLGSAVTGDSIIGGAYVTLILPLSGTNNPADSNDAYIFSAAYRSTEKSVEVTAALPKGLPLPVVTSVTCAAQDPLYVDYTITGMPTGNVYPMYTTTSFRTIRDAWLGRRDVIARITQNNSTLYLRVVSAVTGIIAFSAITENVISGTGIALYQIAHDSTNNSTGLIVPLITGTMTYNGSTNTLAFTQ